MQLFKNKQRVNLGNTENKITHNSIIQRPLSDFLSCLLPLQSILNTIPSLLVTLCPTLGLGCGLTNSLFLDMKVFSERLCIAHLGLVLVQIQMCSVCSAFRAQESSPVFWIQGEHVHSTFRSSRMSVSSSQPSSPETMVGGIVFRESEE